MKKITRRQAMKYGAAALTGTAMGGIAGADNLRPDWGGEIQSVDSIIVPKPVPPLPGTPVCKLTPETIDGPFYFHGAHMRSDIVENRKGVPLRLSIQVVDSSWVNGDPSVCMAIPEAVVDIWQADALGIYSNVPEKIQGTGTIGETFLRGAQSTNGDGIVEFNTIVPGWYLEEGGPPWLPIFGRTMHIHAKIYFRNKVLTTQIYFPDSFIQEIYSEYEPYKDTKDRIARSTGDTWKRTENAEDWVFDLGGPILTIERDGDGFVGKAIVGMFNA